MGCEGSGGGVLGGGDSLEVDRFVHRLEQYTARPDLLDGPEEVRAYLGTLPLGITDEVRQRIRETNPHVYAVLQAYETSFRK